MLGRIVSAGVAHLSDQVGRSGSVQDAAADSSRDARSTDPEDPKEKGDRSPSVSNLLLTQVSPTLTLTLNLTLIPIPTN